MDRWISGGQKKNDVFVGDAETNGCFYPKAIGEKSDSSSWDMEDVSDRFRAAWSLEGTRDEPRKSCGQVWQHFLFYFNLPSGAASSNTNSTHCYLIAIVINKLQM